MACIPTLCEISYDSDLFDEDRFSTPFRISRDYTRKSRGCGIICRSREYGSFGFEKLLPLQCHATTYRDYLRSYYIEQSIFKNGGKIRSPTLPSRTPTRFTWCDSIEDEDATSRDNPSQVVQDHLSPPAHLKSSVWDEGREEPTYQKGSEKIVWVDALNSWVPYKKPVQDKAYVSFVNTPPIIEKCFTTVCRQHGSGEGRRLPRPCDRFQSHMQYFNDSPRQVGQANLRRAVALQNRNTKKSPDGSTWKQNRKAYSTPLSNAESRRNRLPPRAPSAGPSFPQPTPLENVCPAWRSPDIHEGDTVETDAERLELQELLIPSPDTAGDTGQAVDIKPLETRDSDEERSGESVTSVADHTPPDKPDKKQMSSTGGLVNKQQVQQPPPPPPPRPQAASRGQTQSKKSSPRKPATLKPNRSPKKPSKVKSPPQQQKTARPTAKQKKVSSDNKPQPLPISLPVVTAQPPPPSPPSVDSDRGSSEQVEQVRSPIKKRERVVSRRPCKTEEAASEHVPTVVQVQKSADWIYEEKVEEIHSKAEENVQVKLEETVLPAVIPYLPSTHSQTTISRVQRKLQAFRQPIENKKRWGPKKRDTSYEDELRKQELAEARRKRQAEMLERKRKKKFGQKMEEDGITGIPNFEDYGFLAKYCILSRTNLEMYKHAFQAVDDEQRGWLTGTEAMIALRGTNNRLTETEEEYLYRILEMTGYSITNGADFKLFSLLAALSQRIAALDKWMKNLIGQVDFKMLDMKMFKCKTLWECNVDGDTNKISLEQLMIELRAGGVSYQHECEVREKLSHLVALDLLDFLTYVPLFIMIHESVVDNPLDDTREK
ncbi:uncharacterized protein LOC124288863 isoform X2 [Haliotis rubra]|uniref:uncharacterized protein LOC124288863 isoform X2 n=1 Tax=Haliotis rubra TaxID=36100 RepID=UPI001EE59045|nr:uncharacterized protein LOC124288863 isoform X2 [Haliotis rubra]